MYNTAHISIPKQAERLFSFFLVFYPETYRKQFGKEMQLVFSEMYQKELARKGNVGLRFWLLQIGDMTRGVIEQHIDEVNKKGMRTYLQHSFTINKFNIIGGIFLLPVFIMLCVDLISRITQGDLVHYNRPVYAFLSHTPLYWYPVLFTWVFIFPILAVLINTIPLVKDVIKNHGHMRSMRFVLHNLISIALLFFAAFFILLVKFHDFGPCMLHGLARLGFEHLIHIVAVCKNA